MVEEVLKIGDVKVFQRPVVMKCYGLGTCVGVFVKDRLTGITGGAHIFLPDSHSTINGETPSAGDCIRQMLELMRKKGASIETLRAKIAGGGNPLTHHHEIGSRNTQAVIQELVRHRVFIAAMDVGGAISRTVEFDTASGNLLVHQLEQNARQIF